MTVQVRLKDQYVQTIILISTLLPEAIIESMLSPLVPFMVRTLSSDVPESQLDGAVGRRSGILTGSFYFPLLVMNIVWGTLSDGVGRKPVLLLGLFFCGASTLVLGVNTSSFAIAVLCRLLAGVFGANSTVAKGALGEIHMEEIGRTWAYSCYGSLFAISGILGPLIGGILTSNTSNSRYPYFNACFCGTVLSCCALLVAQFLLMEPKEFLKQSKSANLEADADSGSSFEMDERPVLGIKQALGTFCSVSGMRTLVNNLFEPMTPKLVIPIILYVFIAFCNMSWMTLLALLFATEPEHGGLGFTPFASSFAMTLIGVSKLLCHIFLCRHMVRFLGPHKNFCFAMATTVPALLGISFLGGRNAMEGASWYFVVGCMLLVGFVEANAYLSSIVMITDAVPSVSLGAAHGLASTCAALMRTVAPPLAGFAWEMVAGYRNRTWIAFLVPLVAAWSSIGVCIWSMRRMGYSGVASSE
ncbi:hypothetical protein CcCBS67573_g09758 [Chytriomyces confervae]|uniref:Major facilitator superfamily (MFS) profile domain-containing protein n=1 Tax=Chytriomyces confervae TaxID=246404 RepID=A0A507DN31_9FUNG|nr:hypothetical protein HDU80_000824 [Chytriomyces hyalinus]TPX53082.1 hypothetical protein CcCBS67573_g09758 [Chytriomyces confervae]